MMETVDPRPGDPLPEAPLPAENAPAAVPSDEIALCFSGGGYRAAAFHLGTLDILQRLGLLAKVKVLATISGGTITGVLWTLALARGKSFADFFSALYASLLRVNVVSAAFARLASTGREGRRPSLARAAAEIYAGHEFAGSARLGDVMSSEAVPPDLLFCSTEMNTGRAFRFQASRRSDRVVAGSDVLRIPKELAPDIRLADIIASSACFPGAFEPLLFPNDFAMGDRTRAAVAAMPAEKLPLPLVDGGVFDNQGIDAVLLVYGRKVDPGLILVSDSSPRQSDIYRDPPARPVGRLSLGTLFWIARGLAVLAGIQAVVIGYDLWSDFRPTDLIALVTCLAIFGLMFFGRRYLRNLLARVKDATNGVEVWKGLEKLSLGEILELGDRRARSLFSITSAIFLRRIRSLQQSLCFADAELRDRVVFSLIYGLRTSKPSLFRLQPWLAASQALEQRAAAAEKVGTALWISEAELRATIVAGQATTLQELLDLHFTGKLPEVRAILGEGFEERAKALWETLQQNPEALLPALMGTPAGDPAAG